MKVDEFRLSRVWVEGVARQLTEDCGRLGALVQHDVYVSRFKSILETDGDGLITIPWPHTDGKLPAHNNFWNGYVIREIRDHLNSNPGERAWSAIVPFARRTSIFRIDRTERSFVEAWYHPHGVAVAVTAWFKGSFEPGEMEATANAFLRDGLKIESAAGASSVMTLNQLGAAALDAVRGEAFGSVDAGYRPDPLTVLTLLNASAAETEDASAAEPFLRVALSIVGADPDTKPQPDRSIYAADRGRVIWRRDRAVSPAQNLHTLGCLHRNVTVSSMQIASLLRAADMLGALCEDRGNDLPSRIEPFGRTVAGLIARIYGGKGIYSAPFLRAQIAAANAHGRLSALRACFGMGPLA